METFERAKSLCLDLFLLKIHKEGSQNPLVDFSLIEGSRFLSC